MKDYALEIVALICFFVGASVNTMVDIVSTDTIESQRIVREVPVKPIKTPEPIPSTPQPQVEPKPVPVVHRPAPDPPVGAVRTVSSTAYCLPGTMANGERVHDGSVAMNGVAFGTRWRVLSGPYTGRVLTVKDRIGHGSQFDIWMGSCSAARQYGRRSIQIEQVRR